MCIHFTYSLSLPFRISVSVYAQKSRDTETDEEEKKPAWSEYLWLYIKLSCILVVIPFHVRVVVSFVKINDEPNVIFVAVLFFESILMRAQRQCQYKTTTATKQHVFTNVCYAFEHGIFSLCYFNDGECAFDTLIVEVIMNELILFMLYVPNSIFI